MSTGWSIACGKGILIPSPVRRGSKSWRAYFQLDNCQNGIVNGIIWGYLLAAKSWESKHRGASGPVLTPTNWSTEGLYDTRRTGEKVEAGQQQGSRRDQELLIRVQIHGHSMKSPRIWAFRGKSDICRNRAGYGSRRGAFNRLSLQRPSPEMETRDLNEQWFEGQSRAQTTCNYKNAPPKNF